MGTCAREISRFGTLGESGDWHVEVSLSDSLSESLTTLSVSLSGVGVYEARCFPDSEWRRVLFVSKRVSLPANDRLRSDPTDPIYT